MNTTWQDNTLRIEGVALDARLMLIDSAQCFTWREYQGKFYNVLYGSAISVEPRPDGLVLYPVREDLVEAYVHYLDLPRDYGALSGRYAGFPYAVMALERLPGLRVLNQPPWEALVGFILSANNNLSRIRRLCRLLAEHYGEAHEAGGLTLNALPSPEVLSGVSEQALRALGFGYRAPFLVNTARMVAAGFPLGELDRLPYDEAHAELTKLPGVGDKVADCVLLFGCGHSSAFPVDVWVDRLTRAWFPELAQAKSRPALKRASRALFGEDAGLVQQFMFHCARTGLIPVK